MCSDNKTLTHNMIVKNMRIITNNYGRYDSTVYCPYRRDKDATSYASWKRLWRPPKPSGGSPQARLLKCDDVIGFSLFDGRVFFHC